MSTALLPQPFWFRLALPCRRSDDVPRNGKRSRLLDLPASCFLLAPARREGREPFAEIRAAWNAKGLGLSVTASGKAGPVRRDPSEPDYRDGVHLWIDTRDTRDVHRATRFCSRFSALLAPGQGDSLSVEVA